MKRRAWQFALLLVFVLLAGCGGTISAETVKDKDQQRKETAKKMPGNDVPLDPADQAR